MNYKFLVIPFVVAFYLVGDAQAMNGINMNKNNYVFVQNGSGNLLINNSNEQALRVKFGKIAALFSCVDTFYQRASGVVAGQNLQSASLAALHAFGKEVEMLRSAITVTYKTAAALHAECQDVIYSDSIKLQWICRMKKMNEINEKLRMQFFKIKNYCTCGEKRARYSADSQNLCDKIFHCIAILDKRTFSGVPLKLLNVTLSKVNSLDKTALNFEKLGFYFSKENLSLLKPADWSQLELDIKRIKDARDGLRLYRIKIDDELKYREGYEFEQLPSISESGKKSLVSCLNFQK
jgi:hypothetical protein